MNHKQIRFASLIVAGALMLSACSADASIGPSPTAQPIPTQAPAPPQVIIVQQPVPQPQPAPADDGVLIFALLFVLLCAAGLASALAYVLFRQLLTPTPAAHQPAPGSYLIEMTPAEYQEWLQLQNFKARQIAEAQAQWMVQRGR